MSDDPASDLPAPRPPARDIALRRADFPFARVAKRLGLDPENAQVALRDDEQARAAVRDAAAAFYEADDARRSGLASTSPMALDPDFPTGVGMSLVGAAVLWEVREVIPRLALRVATDQYEDGEDALAASYIALAQESVDPGEDDASAWAAQSLLVQVLQRSGAPGQAAEIAQDLARHGVPQDLWKQDDPTLPDDSMSWHGGAFVGGIPPRRDERSLSFEDVHDYLDRLLEDVRREREAEVDGEDGTASD